MAASLKGIDDELKKYLYRNRLPDIYEVCMVHSIPILHIESF